MDKLYGRKGLLEEEDPTEWMVYKVFPMSEAPEVVRAEAMLHSCTSIPLYAGWAVQQQEDFNNETSYWWRQVSDNIFNMFYVQLTDEQAARWKEATCQQQEQGDGEPDGRLS